jgi:hypothetical protein
VRLRKQPVGLSRGIRRVWRLYAWGPGVGRELRPGRGKEGSLKALSAEGSPISLAKANRSWLTTIVLEIACQRLVTSRQWLGGFCHEWDAE